MNKFSNLGNLKQQSNSESKINQPEQRKINLDFDVDAAIGDSKKKLGNSKPFKSFGRFVLNYDGKNDIADQSRQIIFLNEDLTTQSGVIPLNEHRVWLTEDNGKQIPYFVTCLQENGFLVNGDTAICPLCEGGNQHYLAMMFSVLYKDQEDAVNEQGMLIKNDKGETVKKVKFRRGILPVRIYKDNSNNSNYWDNFKDKLIDAIADNNGRLRGVGITLRRSNKQSPLSGEITNWDKKTIVKNHTEQELIDLYGEKGFKTEDGKEFPDNWNLEIYKPETFLPNKERVQEQWAGYQEPASQFSR